MLQQLHTECVFQIIIDDSFESSISPHKIFIIFLARIADNTKKRDIILGQYGLPYDSVENLPAAPKTKQTTITVDSFSVIMQEVKNNNTFSC